MDILKDLESRNVSADARTKLQAGGLDKYETLTAMQFGYLLAMNIQPGDAALIMLYIGQITTPDEAFLKFVAIKPDEEGKFLIALIEMTSELTPEMLLNPANDLGLLDIDGWLLARLAMGRTYFTKPIAERILASLNRNHPTEDGQKLQNRTNMIKAFSGTDQQLLMFLKKFGKETDISGEMVAMFEVGLKAVDMLRSAYKLSQD